MINPLTLILEVLGRTRLAALFVTTLVLTLFDLIGIAIILPYLQVISGASEKVFTFCEQIAGAIGITRPDRESIIIYISIAIVVFFVIKYISSIAISAIQARIYSNNTYNVTNKLFSMLINSEYRLFLNNPGSEMVAISYHSTQHATLCLQSAITGINEFLVLIALVTSMLFVRPLETAIAAGTIGSIGFVTYRIAIRRVANYGVIQQKMDIVRQGLAFTTANSIKDIKIMGLEPLFARKNADIAANYREITWRYQLLSIFPRMTIEHLFLIIFVVGTTSILMLGTPVDQLLPMLGMVGLIAMRAIPGLSKIIQSYNGYRYSETNMIKITDLYQKLLEHAHQDHDLALPFHETLELQDLSFKYGTRQVLDHISLCLRKGQSIGIVGPSGSGKSTLLDILTGLQQKQNGTILLDGAIIDPFSSTVLKRMIGYVPQQITLLDDTIAFNITFDPLFNPERLKQAIHAASLDLYIDSLPDGILTNVGENGVRLSGGQKQRIGIARALYRDPEILLFDEATSALDNITERELSAEIAKLSGQRTVIQVAHRLTSIKNSDVIYVLDKGRIAASGTHNELLQTSPLYAEMCRTQHNEA